MKLPHRRQFLHLAAGAAALPAVSHIAWAQTYPTRPVRVIVPYAPSCSESTDYGYEPLRHAGPEQSRLGAILRTTHTSACGLVRRCAAI
jgi:hypothetical protein